MKEIKWLARSIDGELEAAEHYAKAAQHYKDSDRELARLCYSLAGEELNHSDKLHREAVRLIKEQAESGNEVPAAMRAVWDWEHEKMIERSAKIQNILALWNS